MIPNRIPDEYLSAANRITQAAPAGFLMIPVAAAVVAQPSPLQNLYQEMYEQAVAATQKSTVRDLFVVMN